MLHTATINSGRIVNLKGPPTKAKRKTSHHHPLIGLKEEILPDVPSANLQINGVKITLTETARKMTHGCCMNPF